MDNNNSRYDSIVTTDKWEFNEAVSSCFDNMLERSIPRYDRMRDLVFAFGKEYVKEGAAIVDIGCSLGNSLSPFVERFGSQCSYIGIDPSEAMVRRVIERFRKEIDSGYVQIIPKRIEDYELRTRSCLIMSVLTLQFVSVELRRGIIGSLYDALIPGGRSYLLKKRVSTTLI